MLILWRNEAPLVKFEITSSLVSLRGSRLFDFPFLRSASESMSRQFPINHLPRWATSALLAEGHDGPIPLSFNEMEFPQQLVSKFDHQNGKNIL